MNTWPLKTSAAEGAKPADSRITLHLDDWHFSLTKQQAAELAERCRDAIEYGTQEAPVGNDQGQSVEAIRLDRRFYLNFRSPHPNQAMQGLGDGWSLAEARKFISQLEAFSA